MSDSTPMTPQEAREALKNYKARQLTPGTGHYHQNAGYRALETIANLGYDSTYTVDMGRVFVNDVDRVDFPEDTKVRRFVGEWKATDE